MKATHHPPTSSRTARVEGLVLVLILICVAGFAGAASFTHVKDWTLANSPPGTGEWFGWANAVISELVPIAALLTIRQRRRTQAPIGYPMFLLIAAATLSLSAQLAVANPSPSGWLLSAVPALAFMALAKLVLAPVKTTATEDTTPATPAATPAAVPVDTSASTPPTTTGPEQVGSAPQTRPEVPAHLLPAARFAVINHEQHTGRPITADELASRLNITPTLAGQVLATLNSPAMPARMNGVPVLDEATA